MCDKNCEGCPCFSSKIENEKIEKEDILYKKSQSIVDSAFGKLVENKKSAVMIFIK